MFITQAQHFVDYGATIKVTSLSYVWTRLNKINDAHRRFLAANIAQVSGRYFETRINESRAHLGTLLFRLSFSTDDTEPQCL